MRQFGRPTTLDLRFTIQPFNRTGCALASVFAYQEGLPPFKGSEWRRIGAVAAREESQLPIAVARQRELIETWACCLVTDFRTVRAGLGILRPLAASPALPRLARAHAHSQRSCDRVRYVCQGKKLMTRRKPIKLAWALPPRFGQISWPSGYLNEVPAKTPRDDSVRCGFFGDNCISVKSEGGGFRFEPVDELLPR